MYRMPVCKSDKEISGEEQFVLLLEIQKNYAMSVPLNTNGVL